ncbi:catalase-related domain-containing protein, partial [Enterobacter hormaechei]
LYELLDDAEHQRMFKRLAGELIEASEETQKRQIDLFIKVHAAYGAGVEKALNALK